MLCACINQNKVVGLLEFETDQQYADMAHEFELMIDTSNYPIVPEIGWTYVPESNSFNYGQLNISPSVKISKLAFVQRFTDNEFMTILQKSTDTNFPYYLAVKAMLEKQARAEYIDLYRPETIAGVGYLVSFGIISSQRATEILTTPPKYEEIYKG